MKVLIVRIGAMGDVLHAMPAVTAMRELHPDWEIGWAVEPQWSALLGEPLVDRAFFAATKEWGKNIFSRGTASGVMGLQRELRAEQFDLCVDMQGSIKSAVVGRMAGARRFVGMAAPRERQAAWLYGERIKVSAAHVIEQGCELLGAAIGETLQPAKVALPVDEAAEAWCDGVVDGPFVLMAPTAGWGAKEWPPERFGAVAAELGARGIKTLVNASLAGDKTARGVVEASGGFATAVPCSIPQLVALTRRASLVIAGDTGPLHIAAALERRVVGLYGPTDPARNGPYGTKAVVLRDPSRVTDHSRVAESGLMGIGVEAVVEAALELLQKD
jgi:heptosyltransferase I